MLTFDDEKRARVECAHLNARSNSNLHYSIKRLSVRRSAKSN